MVICNRIANKTSLQAIVFLNINHKEGLGFQGCAGNMAVLPYWTNEYRSKRDIQGNFLLSGNVLGGMD